MKDQLPVKDRTAVKCSKYMYPNTASCGYEPTTGMIVISLSTHSPTHPHTHTQHTRNTPMHTHTCTHTHARHTCTLAHTHTCTHTHACTHTHTHTHIPSPKTRLHLPTDYSKNMQSEQLKDLVNRRRFTQSHQEEIHPQS